MNFQQLRIVRETVRQDFNLTTVANTLFTSQPGVSKHIKDLEDELGIEIFVRHGKRLLGLTEPGKELLAVVERILLDVQNARSIADHFSNRETGNLVIATEWLNNVPEIATFPYYTWHHAVIVPRDHPLTQLSAPTLADIADYPIITYHEGFTGRTNIDRSFAEAGLVPDIVLSAIDADVIKTYVDVGLGIGIVASMAYHPERDTNLVRIDVPDLFQPNTTRLAIRRGVYLRDYAYDFIFRLVPELNAERIAEVLSKESLGREDFVI